MLLPLRTPEICSGISAFLLLEATADVLVAPPYVVVVKMKKQVRIGAPVPLLGAKPERVLVRLRPGKTELVINGLVADEAWSCGGPARPVVDLVPDARRRGDDPVGRE